MNYVQGLMALLLLVSISSCKKQSNTVIDNNTTGSGYVPIPDTGTYSVQSGSLTIATPDTAITFTAPGDTITFVTSTPDGVPTIGIYLKQQKDLSTMSITSTVDRKSGAVGTVGSCDLSENSLDTALKAVVTLHKYYSVPYTTAQKAAPFTLNYYNTRGVLASGVFFINEPRDEDNPAAVANYKLLTGRFNFNLTKNTSQ